MGAKSRIRIDRSASGEWESVFLLTGDDPLAHRVAKIPDLLARIPYKGVVLIGAALSGVMSLLVFLLFEDWRIAVGTWVALMLLVLLVESTAKSRDHRARQRRLEGSDKVGSVLRRYDFPEEGRLGMMLATRILDSYETILAHPAIGSLVALDRPALTGEVWSAVSGCHRVAVRESQDGPDSTTVLDGRTLEPLGSGNLVELRILSAFHGQMLDSLDSLDRAQHAYVTHLSGEQEPLEIRVLEDSGDSVLGEIIQRSEAVVALNGGRPRGVE